MTPGLRIARAWQAEDGTLSRLAEMINEEHEALRAVEAASIEVVARSVLASTKAVRESDAQMRALTAALDALRAKRGEGA